MSIISAVLHIKLLCFWADSCWGFFGFHCSSRTTTI